MSYPSLFEHGFHDIDFLLFFFSLTALMSNGPFQKWYTKAPEGRRLRPGGTQRRPTGAAWGKGGIRRRLKGAAWSEGVYEGPKGAVWNEGVHEGAQRTPLEVRGVTKASPVAKGVYEGAQRTPLGARGYTKVPEGRRLGRGDIRRRSKGVAWGEWGIRRRTKGAARCERVYEGAPRAPCGRVGYMKAPKGRRLCEGIRMM